MGQELGNAVKDSIQEKKISFIQLAKELDIDRTTLQHYFTGKRQMQLETLQRMMMVLNLTKEKRNALYTLYEEECTDKDLIKNANDIFSLYKSLDNHRDLNKKNTDETEYCIKNDVCYEKTQIVKGQVNIEALIRSCFSEEMSLQESAHVIMSINFKHLFLYESIIRIAKEQTKCGKIENIIPLVNKKKLGNNLDILKMVLPLKCLDNMEYEPYFFYTGTKIYDDISIIVPNYFITAKQVITIDRDFESAIISDNPQIIEYYRDKARSIIKNCERLVEKNTSSDTKKNMPVLEEINEDGESIKFYASDQMYQQVKESFVQPTKIGAKQIAAQKNENRVERPQHYFLRDGFASSIERVSIRYFVEDKRIEFIIADEDNQTTSLSVSELGIVTVFKEVFHYLRHSFYVYTEDELNHDLKSMESLNIFLNF